jgi:hypothetical protein
MTKKLSNRLFGPHVIDEVNSVNIVTFKANFQSK